MLSDAKCTLASFVHLKYLIFDKKENKNKYKRIKRNNKNMVIFYVEERWIFILKKIQNSLDFKQKQTNLSFMVFRKLIFNNLYPSGGVL